MWNRLFFFIILSFFSTSLFGGDYDLVVYYSSLKPVRDREQNLKKSLNQENITVFAHLKDFMSIVKNNLVPIVIAPESFEFVDSRYKPVLQLVTNSKANT